MMTNSNSLHRAFTLLVAAPLALGACIDLHETESGEEDTTELADSPLDDAPVLDDQPEVASGDDPVLPPGCEMYAWTPILDGTTIRGGGQWSGCPSTSGFTILLKRHRSWYPDQTLASAERSGTAGSVLLLKGNCWRGGSTTVYSEIRHRSSGVMRQARVTLPCSF